MNVTSWLLLRRLTSTGYIRMLHYRIVFLTLALTAWSKGCREGAGRQRPLPPPPWVYLGRMWGHAPPPFVLIYFWHFEKLCPPPFRGPRYTTVPSPRALPLRFSSDFGHLKFIFKFCAWFFFYLYFISIHFKYFLMVKTAHASGKISTKSIRYLLSIEQTNSY